MFNNRHFFNGRINKQSVNDFTLDYSFSDLDSRMDYLINILDKTKDEYGRNFFEVYFDEYYKSVASMEDSLSENINVCKRLEYMADYLLRSTEVRLERKNDEMKYYFFVNKEEFLKRTKFETSSDSVNTESKEMDFLVSKKQNAIKKPKQQVITKEDAYREDAVGSILKAYTTYIELLNSAVSEGLISKRKASSIKGSINDDMIKSKDMLDGVFGYILRNPIAESTRPDWDKFDYTNEEHIKLALNIDRELDAFDDLSHIVLDLSLAIKDLTKAKKLTKRQLEILHLYRQGCGFTEIATELNVSPVNVYKIIMTVSKKIAKYYIVKGC